MPAGHVPAASREGLDLEAFPLCCILALQTHEDLGVGFLERSEHGLEGGHDPVVAPQTCGGATTGCPWQAWSSSWQSLPSPGWVVWTQQQPSPGPPTCQEHLLAKGAGSWQLQGDSATRNALRAQ